MQREPIFNVPAAVLVALLVLALVHAGLSVLPADEANWAMLAMAFIPARYSALGGELPGGWPAAVTSGFTYQLVHANLTHLLVNSAWLLAFGSAVAARIGALRFFVFSLLCGLGGAVAFLILRWGDPVPVVGASGAVSGLMAAALRFFFAAVDGGGLEQMRESPRSVPLMSLAQTLTNRRILVAVGLWIAINFIMALAAPAITPAAGIAWEAHLGGFLTGLLTFGAFNAPAAARDASAN